MKVDIALFALARLMTFSDVMRRTDNSTRSQIVKLTVIELFAICTSRIFSTVPDGSLQYQAL